MAEEAELGTLEGGHDGGRRLPRLRLPLLGDAYGVQRRAQVLVDELVGVGPGVPNGDVVFGQRVAQRLVLHTFEG